MDPLQPECTSELAADWQEQKAGIHSEAETRLMLHARFALIGSETGCHVGSHFAKTRHEEATLARALAVYASLAQALLVYVETAGVHGCACTADRMLGARQTSMGVVQHAVQTRYAQTLLKTGCFPQASISFPAEPS